MNNPGVVIKKYSDRRLYDSTARKYVKLDDIAQMIRNGVEVKVVDGRTGKDLTYRILTQIVVEDARDRESALPVQLLRHLVRATDRATHDFLSWYLNSTLDLYEKAQEAARTRISEAKSAVSNPLDFVRNLLAGHAWPSAQDASEVEKLRRRVEELEARLAAADHAPPRARRRAAARR